MITIRRMPVPIVGVVEVIIVSERLVPAARPVRVRVAGVGQMRQRVLVIVIIVWGVGVALVDVVGVALTLDAGMPAAGAVLVGVGVMNGVLGSHGSSLLW
jgi:hypothetical protein